MVKQELGESIDIHLGGSDLIFPHHENEIAQSEACNGKELAKYWLHNGMVNVGGEKMSKSLGNFTTIRSLLNDGVSPMTLRFFVLQTNYRKPLDFTNEALKAASKGWNKINLCLSFGRTYFTKELREKIKNGIEANGEQLSRFSNIFEEYMDDDLNTSGALSVLFELSNPIRTLKKSIESNYEVRNLENYYYRWQILAELSSVLGLKEESLKDRNKIDINKEEVNLLIEERSKAKIEKDFVKSDKIRDELKDMGVTVVDKKGGLTEWFLN